MKPYLKAGIITAIIAGLGYLGVSLILLVSSFSLAINARSGAVTLADQLSTADAPTSLRRIEDLGATLAKAESRARWSFWLKAVPFLRQPYLAYTETLTAAHQFTVAAHSLAPVFTGNTADWGLAIGQAYPSLLQGIDDLQAALNRLHKVSPTLIPPTYTAEWQTILANAGNIMTVLQDAQPFLQQLPLVLGQNEPFDVLVLLQNTHELRATGGFLGTYGRFTLDRGQVTTFFTDDIYNLDAAAIAKLNIKPPQPMKEYLNVDRLYLWDANWSPDFPTSAALVSDLYLKTSAEDDLDLVIAFTPAIVEQFLALTGPITVDNITFTSENLIDALEYRVEQEFWRIGLKDEQRKKIINDLAQELKRRFFALTPQQAVAMKDSTQDLLKSKDILAYSTEPTLQRLIFASGWGGEIVSAAHDYLFVVDTNLGALKTDRLVDRTYDYAVKQQADGSWLATVRLTYRNNGFFDYRTTRYRNYARVYAPMGSALRESAGFQSATDVYTEQGKQVFAAFISVEPGQEKTATFSYVLPAWLTKSIQDEARYNLVWQKQPGTKPQARFAIETQQKLYSFAPSDVSYKLENPQRLQANTPLRADQNFTVRFAP